jgi:hypothetical protein
MKLTKEEFKKTYSQLNKLVVKKEAFKSIYHLVPNKYDIKAHDPIYLKFFVQGRQAPINI